MPSVDLLGPQLIAQIIAALGNPAIVAALNVALTPTVVAAVNAAVGPAVNAAVGPAITAAVLPLENKVARSWNRSSLSQGTPNASLMPLRHPVTGAVPHGFPPTKHDFDDLSHPLFTQAKLDSNYRWCFAWPCMKAGITLLILICDAQNALTILLIGILYNYNDAIPEHLCILTP